MNKTHLALAICLAFALGACGGGSGGDNVASDGANNSPGSGDSGNNGSTGGSDGGSGSSGGGDAPTGGDIQFFGTVSVSDSPSNMVDMTGSFVRFGAQVPFPRVEEAMRPKDNCEVSAGFSPPPDDSDGPDFDVSIDFVSAGAAIPFTSATGSYTSMPRRNEFGIIFYSQEDVQGPPPAGLTFTIPGDVYPAFANIPVAEIQPIQWIAPAQGETITAQSTLSWEAGSNPDAVVSISALSFDARNPQGAKILTCDLIDDGSHTFSAQTQAAMGADFSAAGPPSPSRSVTTAHRNGSAILFVRRDS